MMESFLLKWSEYRAACKERATLDSTLCSHAANRHNLCSVCGCPTFLEREKRWYCRNVSRTCHSGHTLITYQTTFKGNITLSEVLDRICMKEPGVIESIEANLK